DGIGGARFGSNKPRAKSARILSEWQKKSTLEICRFGPQKQTLVTCSARLAKLNRFKSSPIAIPDARKVSPLCKWPTTPLRKKQSSNSMAKKSADVTSLSVKHGKNETSGAAVAAGAGGDIDRASIAAIRSGF